MKVYWDASAVINAMISPKVEVRLQSDEHYTRPHAFAEFFATMTGRGITLPDANANPTRFKMSAQDASAWLRTFARRVNLVDLDLPELLDGLDRAQELGVQGAGVYDYGHVLAAEKAKADVILTRNVADFTPLAGTTKVEWP